MKYFDGEILSGFEQDVNATSVAELQLGVTKHIDGEALEVAFALALPSELLIGAKIYAVRCSYYGFHQPDYYIDETTVKEIGLDRKGWYITTQSNVRNRLNAVGRTIFITRKEAEEYIKDKPQRNPK